MTYLRSFAAPTVLLVSSALASCSAPTAGTPTADAGHDGGNPQGCPVEMPQGSCTTPGLSCAYNGFLDSTTCIDGVWLECGDAPGTACNDRVAAPVEGSLCCVMAYTKDLGGGGTCCAGGRVCECVDNHVHCTATCDDAGTDASADAASDAPSSD